ncbi:Di-copper centre-containing protein [Ramicandelaber brevisporus]|nr:Di-copper centre-containing protein [Ramicandelaber brevisporus]
MRLGQFAWLVSFFLYGAACFALPVSTCPGSSLSAGVRKELRALTEHERIAFMSALHHLNPPTHPNTFDNIVHKYLIAGPQIRGHPQSLPWMRQFLREFETHLQRVSGNSSMMLPFWDSSLDAQNPAASPVFAAKWLSGQTNDDTCRTENAGGIMPWSVHWGASGQPQQHCLKRSFNGASMASYYPTTAVENVLNTVTDFTDLAAFLEGTLLSSIQVGFAGDISSSVVPNDPLFYLMRANVDRLWAQWQKVHPNVDSQLPFKMSDQLVALDGTIGSVWTIDGLCYLYHQQPQSSTSPAATQIQKLPSMESTADAQQQPSLTTLLSSLVPMTSKKPFKHVPTIPITWLQMNNFNATAVQHWEHKLAHHINHINSHLH